MEILMKTPYPHNWWQTEGWNTWDFTAQTGCHKSLHTFMESGVPSSSISERRQSLHSRLQSGTVHDIYPKENIISTFHRQTGRPCFGEKENGREPGICSEARGQGLGLNSRNGKSRDNWGAITFCRGSQKVHHHVIAWVSLLWKCKLMGGWCTWILEKYPRPRGHTLPFQKYHSDVYSTSSTEPETLQTLFLIHTPYNMER